MKSTVKDNTQNNSAPVKKAYQTPAIIHEGQITTRAGSPISIGTDSSSTDVDPADLFGDD